MLGYVAIVNDAHTCVYTAVSSRIGSAEIHYEDRCILMQMLMSIGILFWGQQSWDTFAAHSRSRLSLRRAASSTPPLTSVLIRCEG